MNNAFDIFSVARNKNKKLLAVLIDPDKRLENDAFKKFILDCINIKVDLFLVGGSLLSKGDLEETILKIKNITKIPVIIFPGDSGQISSSADALLLLSVISGRNADLLIGQHVSAAFQLQRSSLELIPTGYLLIESGVVTTAQYVSGTNPIPRTKNEIATATALAGQQLGLKIIYLDAGSGAKESIPTQMINSVKNTITIPLIVGGGIKNLNAANAAWEAGADCVVIGTLFEHDPNSILEFKNR